MKVQLKSGPVLQQVWYKQLGALEWEEQGQQSALAQQSTTQWMWSYIGYYQWSWTAAKNIKGEADMWNQYTNSTGPQRLYYISEAAETEDTSKQAMNIPYFLIEQISQ